LRDKEMKGRDYYQAALVIKDVCKENNVLFIVNDRLDVALAAEADGVHLGQEDLPLHAAKKRERRRRLLGCGRRFSMLS